MIDRGGLQLWEVWYPKAAATGLLVARGRLYATDVIILHGGPDVITVEVTDGDGNRLAFGKDLQRTEDSPMCRLRREGRSITREDIWPTDNDFGTPVLLPGGEVGILKGWWNADDKMEWRWDVQFYNSRR